jgi:ribosomal protein S18 acetylase RimI-like enzyme
MAFAEAEAARQGLAEVRLYTHGVMAGAQALYRALGYRETARRVEDGYARIHFARRLPGP